MNNKLINLESEFFIITQSIEYLILLENYTDTENIKINSFTNLLSKRKKIITALIAKEYDL